MNFYDLVASLRYYWGILFWLGGVGLGGFCCGKREKVS